MKKNWIGEPMKELRGLFKKKAKRILVYISRETLADPFEKNVNLTTLNPIPLPALVSDLLSDKTMWKMYGVQPNRARKLVLEKRYREIIEMSSKIKVDGDSTEYVGWKDYAGNQIQIKEDGDYIILYIYSK